MAGVYPAITSVTIGRMTFDAHTRLFASLAVICGTQSVLFAAIAKTFAITEGVLPHDPSVQRLSSVAMLERGLILGVVVGLVGALMLFGAFNEWRIRDFGRLNYA